MDSEKPNRAEAAKLPDAELWQALQQGQTEALGVLYGRHAGLVYGIALKVLKSSQEAEDLTQEIFVNFLPRSSYDPRRGSLRTYLSILVRSRAISRARSRQKREQKIQPHLQPDTLPSEATSALEESTRREESQIVQAALATLSENEQQLLKLSYYEGLTQAAIAESTGLPLGTVKSRVRRGLTKLRQVLKKRVDP